LGLAQKLNDKEKISGSLINIGNVFLYKGEYVNATTQYLQALRLAEEINYTDGIDVITANLGAIYYYQGDLAKAETYYRRSLQIDRQENDNEGIASNLESLGVVYVDQKKYNQAFSHFEESRAISERIGNLNGVATAMSGIAKVYEKTGKWQKALEVNRKALPIAEQIQNKMLVAVLKINMADVYRHLHQYTASLQYGKQALELSRQTDQKENTKAAYESLTNTYEAMRQPQQALLYYKQFVQYKDSLLNETNVHKVNELQTQYETEKKEQQIKMLSQQAQINQLQLQQQRFYIAACVALVLLVILFGFLFISQQALKNHQRTTELEQKLLVTQMNPHFIFNALIAIQNFMFKNNPVEAGKYLAKFAKLMRLILENSRQPYITLSKEIQTLEYYFELQQLRFQQAFDFQIYVDPQLSPEQVSVPPMFVQPLVENALEHGLLHKTDKGIVKVRYLLKGDKILLEVEDNGVGLKESAQFKQSTQPGYTSLATKITQERLAILNHSKNRKVTFNVVDLVNVDQIVQGTKATFFIPFKTLT
jgi:tetratricopeptide (TPR) repeat protein